MKSAKLPVNLILVFLLLVGGPASIVMGSDYIVDEQRALPRHVAPIDDLTSSFHALNWMLGLSAGNGFHLLDRLPTQHDNTVRSKSAAIHPKYFGIIYKDEVFDVNGEPVASAFGRLFPEDEDKRQTAEDLGLFGMIRLLPEPFEMQDMVSLLTPIIGVFPTDSPEELVIWGRDEQDRPKALKVMRNAILGGSMVLPRDFYREVDQLPLGSPETIFEYRVSFPTRLDFGDGPEIVNIPFRCVIAVTVRRCVAGSSRKRLGLRPRLTHVDEILDPSEDLCNGDCSSWFLADTEPARLSDDGELCFDVDHITSLDMILPMYGAGALKALLDIMEDRQGTDMSLAGSPPGPVSLLPQIESADTAYSQSLVDFLLQSDSHRSQSAQAVTPSAAPVIQPSPAGFPGVLEEGFDDGPQSPYRAYMAGRCLLNRGFRVLDTNNFDGEPAILDVAPLTNGMDFSADYDGAPIEIGYHTRYIYGPGLSGRQLMRALGGFPARELIPISVYTGEYRRIIRNVRFYVDGPRGKQQVTMPQLLQLIQSMWHKGAAYAPPHNLIEDHPRVDLGRQNEFTFEVRAWLKLGNGGFSPVIMVVSAYPGLYTVDVYGGDPLE